MRRFALTTVAGLLLAGLGLTAHAPLSAQSVVLDEGRFTVFIDGREAGSESFRIHRDGSGPEAVLVATAEVRLQAEGGTIEMRPSLRTGPDMVPQAYENKVSGARTAQVSGWLDGNRFVARTASAEGESQKEFRAGASTVVLEDRVAYLYYFTARGVQEAGGSLMVVSPMSGEQYRLQVLSIEVEPYRLGREQLEARHVRLEGPNGVHELWLDDQDRVLRVEIPHRSFRAERDAS
jgi:hypothetical protein